MSQHNPALRDAIDRCKYLEEDPSDWTEDNRRLLALYKEVIHLRHKLAERKHQLRAANRGAALASRVNELMAYKISHQLEQITELRDQLHTKVEGTPPLDAAALNEEFMKMLQKTDGALFNAAAKAAADFVRQRIRRDDESERRPE